MQNPATDFPDSLYRAAQVRELDSLIISESGITGEELMERAGAAAFSVLRDHWPDINNITVVCGGGNNGGDGYVIARLALDAGFAVTVLSVVSLDALKGDALVAKNRLVDAGLLPKPCSVEELDASGLIVDAILGTGLDRPVSGEMYQAIEAINRFNGSVYAIDIPSGLNADTGSVMGIGVEADVTISFVAMKQGLLTGQGPACCGRLYFSDLAGPSQVYNKLMPAARRINYNSIHSVFARRKPCTHKGHYGHVLVIGGESGYTGAPQMAAEAACRTGAGLVSLATRQEHAALITVARPEIMAHGVRLAVDLDPLISKATVIAIGPGLGQSDWSRKLFARTLETGLPLVIDADGINLLASDPVENDQWILTPHPGEAARLLSCTTSDIQSDRFAAVAELQARYGGYIVLKGCGTLIMNSHRQITLCTDGNPGMATGGMGDVLTGVIAGLLAQGLSLDQAASAGVCLHSTAADRAAAAGERGLLASDLMPWIRQLVNPA